MFLLVELLFEDQFCFNGVFTLYMSKHNRHIGCIIFNHIYYGILFMVPLFNSI